MKSKVLNGLVAALAVSISAMPISALAFEKETWVCENVKHCLQIEVAGIQAEVCITLRECRVETADG